VGGLRKRAYYFLRNAAASFLATHRSNTQISHNAIRNPATDSSNPMSFQKELAPPGIYDGICAIAKDTSQMCAGFVDVIRAAAAESAVDLAAKVLEVVLAQAVSA
jgi:hypothetical protein